MSRSGEGGLEEEFVHCFLNFCPAGGVNRSGRGIYWIGEVGMGCLDWVGEAGERGR